jgi:hypothetical protein
VLSAPRCLRFSGEACLAPTDDNAGSSAPPSPGGPRFVCDGNCLCWLRLQVSAADARGREGGPAHQQGEAEGGDGQCEGKEGAFLSQNLQVADEAELAMFELVFVRGIRLGHQIDPGVRERQRLVEPDREFRPGAKENACRSILDSGGQVVHGVDGGVQAEEGLEEGEGPAADGKEQGEEVGECPRKGGAEEQEFPSFVPSRQWDDHGGQEERDLQIDGADGRLGVGDRVLEEFQCDWHGKPLE